MAKRGGSGCRVEFDVGTAQRLEIISRLQQELGASSGSETMRRILDILGELPPGVLPRLPALLAQVPQPRPQESAAPLVPAQQGAGGRFRL